MAEKQEQQARATLEKVRAAFASVEWLEPEPGKFWTARVRFGETDYAVITVVSGGLLTQVLRQLASLEGLHKRLTGIEAQFAAERADDGAEDSGQGRDDPADSRLRNARQAAQFAEMLAGLLVEADITLWNEVVQPLFTACVSKLVLPELGEATGADVARSPSASIAERIQFVRSLPVVLTARVLIGIAVQAGNLAVRSSKN